MKLGNFSGLTSELIELRAEKGASIIKNDWKIKDEVGLAFDAGSFVLFQGKHVISIVPVKNVPSLQLKLQQGNNLWALITIKKQAFYLQSVELVTAPIMLNLDLGVTHFYVDQLYKRDDIKNENISSALKWFQNEFILEGGDETQARIIVATYAGNNQGSLEILGQQWVATLQETDDYWTVKKLSRTKKRGATLRVLQGNIQFIDASVAKRLENTTYKQLLDQSLQDYGSYIQLWRQYSDMEWVMNLSAARKLGSLPFKAVDNGEKPTTWDFITTAERAIAFKERWQEIKSHFNGGGDLLLEVVSTLPDWLENEQELESTGFEKLKSAPWLAELVSIKDGLITLRLKSERDYKPIKNGFICLSMHGYRVNRERRTKALEQIQKQNNPMPQLHHLLQGIVVPSERRKDYKAITPAARAKFKGEPTPKQKEALKIALRTPDIAIIIGPPGTGKTQVITALQIRLAEELNDQPIQHQMLISSFQHDALDNVMARSNVFGLPAIKAGGKRNKKGDTSIDPIESWCSSRAMSLESSLEQLLEDQPAFQTIKALRKQLVVLRVSKFKFTQRIELITGINTLLNELAQRDKIRLSSTIEGRWKRWSESDINLKNAKSTFTKDDNCTLLRHVRALRVTNESFIDDGATQCARLLDAYSQKKSTFTKTQFTLLKTLSDEITPNMAQLTGLKQLKKMLIDQLIPDYRPYHVQTRQENETCHLIDDISNDINNTLKSTHNLAYLNVLEEYRLALIHSPHMIKKAVQEYTSVLGATCQQAAGNQMQSIHQVKYQNEINFDTVIVDEAARANPLDLMIPMAMGRRRIILVGDHRQLPHLLEPKVEDELAEKFELDEVQREMFKISLFEKLMISLREMGKEPGQPKRVVMLDTQFRMHPVLGKFVSEQFYEKHGLDEVKSGLPAENFWHPINKYQDKVCSWIEVPTQNGKSQRVNGSLKREAEALVIAKEAKRILEQCPELSVGVITFYSAQVDCILHAMEKEDLTHHHEGKRQIKPEWKQIKKEDGTKTERLRVGSVDAFQGKEFDVVLLSIVRTAPGQIDLNNDSALTKGYGFLRLDNRLNVAMSRQKCLLIVIGDPDLATHPATSKAAPSLNALYQLCESTNGIIY